MRWAALPGLYCLITSCFPVFSGERKIELVFDDTPQFNVSIDQRDGFLTLCQYRGVGQTAFSLPGKEVKLKPCRQYPEKPFLLELWSKNKAILMRNGKGSWHLDELIKNVNTYLSEGNTAPLPLDHLYPLLIFTSANTITTLSLLLGCRPVPKSTWFSSESMLDPRSWRFLNLFTNNSDTLLPTFRESEIPLTIQLDETVTVNSYYLTIRQDPTTFRFNLQSTEFIGCEPVEIKMVIQNTPLPSDFLSVPNPESWMQWGERQIDRLPIPENSESRSRHG